MDKAVLIVKHVEQEGPGMLGKIFEDAGWRLVTVELGRREALPDRLDSFAAVVMLGGPMNVYEEEAYPFLKDEDVFIKEVLREEIPFLGICLGAQLLAKACGARVMKAAQKEVGWYSVDLTKQARQDRLFKRVESPLTVFQWHEDTFDIPDGGVLLATSALVRNQAFGMGSCAYGLQFHVEVSLDMVEEWMKDEKTVDAEKILRQGAIVKETLEQQAATLFNNFRRLAESAVRVKGIMKLFLEKKSESRRTLWWDEEEKTLVQREALSQGA
ncbi:MAG TPA: type 1 glutamine amidotransferase [Syntrophorhabdales bacterium]|nr:type 1 glutamine amidotransferase [Syntrophorhabdales bacterium]